MKFIYKLLSKIMGRNIGATPVSVIADQLHEKRMLPVGMMEFEEWSDRIISGTLLPADKHGMKFALAAMIMHLRPTEDCVEDAYFIHALRKSAANQVAHAKMAEHKAAAEAKYQAEKDTNVTNVVSITEGTADASEVLAKK